MIVRGKNNSKKSSSTMDETINDMADATMISANDTNSEILVPEEISYKEIENDHFTGEQFIGLPLQAI